ncbi:MAG: M15 family metallopeptidase [Patescibacteria group bacterium]
MERNDIAKILLSTVLGLILMVGMTLYIDSRVTEAPYEPPPVEEIVLASPQELLQTTEPEPLVSFNTELGVYDCSSGCTLAAVDKQHGLPPDYIPAGMISLLKGRGTMIPEAAAQADLLLDALRNEHGVNVEVISSYRSSQSQQNVYNDWIETYESRGLSYGTAIKEANKISALPGHSEHQLGTTLDIKTAGTTTFDKAQNAELYGLIEEFAHIYGFVISYPEGLEEQTGYLYEPWHIRYIGPENATKLYNLGYLTGSGQYLSKFLREQNLSD